MSEAVKNLLEEVRTVLPGVQALFGFQLVAVFNQRFTDLTSMEQGLHLTALCLVALAAGLLMTPAALHRQTSPEEVSAVAITRQPLWNNLKHEHGPFDIIGDVHGCYEELTTLLARLGSKTL